jgi:poly(3-hydroxybutyrate) depolymerase
MRRTQFFVRHLLAAAVALSPLAAARGQTQGIAPGNGEQSVSVLGTTLEVWTWRPSGCTPGLLLVVFHGLERNAGPYRDFARPLAEKLCAVVVAPKYDEGRFPSSRYQQGGIADHGRLLPEGSRPVDLVAPLVAWAQQSAGQPSMPYVLIGHSAGAQFLSRVAAFTTTGARRIVIADPSTWVLPSVATAVPFGFGGITPASKAEQALRAYLAQPISVVQGGADTGTKNLSVTPDAMAQGENRRERAHNAFQAAQQASASHGWALNWTFAEVPDVGHNASRIFISSQVVDALLPLAGRH